MNVKQLTFKGRTQSIEEWARETGINPATLQYRLSVGWPLQKAFAKPPRRCVTFEGVTRPIAQWARELGISKNTLRSRLKAGWTIEKAFVAPSAAANDNVEQLTLNGVTQPISEWASDFGIPAKLIEQRLNEGWSIELAITTPMTIPHKGYRLPAPGVDQNFGEDEGDRWGEQRARSDLNREFQS